MGPSAHSLDFFGTWFLNCWRRVTFDSFPVAVWGSSFTQTTSSGIHHFAIFPCIDHSMHLTINSTIDHYVTNLNETHKG